MLYREHCPTMQVTDFYKYVVYVPRDRTRMKRGKSWLILWLHCELLIWCIGTEELFLSSTFKTISDDYRKSVKVLNDAG
ncbi:hypothetical protein K435DRAFT_764585, partial [Dendrothele bispora CBS 962.96]